jgi:hypothetical protein
MAVDKVTLRWTFKAGADLSAKQYTVVKITSSDTIVAAASGDVGVVLIDNPKENLHGTVALGGVAKVKVGTEVKEGEFVAPKNDGTIQPAASGQFILGQALETGKAGSYVPVLIHAGTGAKA